MCVDQYALNLSKLELQARFTTLSFPIVAVLGYYVRQDNVPKYEL